MSLDLRVAHVRKTKAFYAGDTISGTVTIKGSINAPIILSIRFKGKSQTLIKQSNGQSTSRYTDKVRFFTLVTTLFEGECSLEPGVTSSYPFSFQLPFQTEPEKGNPDIKHSKKDAPYAKTAHPLPPSFSVKGSTWSKKYEAKILYELRAELRYPKSTFTGTAKKKGHLPLTHCRLSAEPPDPQPVTHRETFTHSSSKLLPNRAKESRSFKQWASDTFSNSAPSATFTLSATAPTALLEGQIIPIRLCYAFDPKRSTGLDAPPELKLLSACYEVKEYDHVRGHSMFLESTAEKSKVISTKSMLCGDTLKSDVAYDIGEAKQLRLPESKLVPSFGSYAVCRRYGATLNVRFEYGGKEFNPVYKWKPVILLPSGVKDEEGDEGEGEGGRRLSRSSSIGALSFGEGMELGGQLVEAVIGLAQA